MTDTSPHKEYCLMEKCNNSIRMSLRLKFEDADPMERIIGKKYMSNFTNHADDYCILRRRALEVCHNRDFLIYRNSFVPLSHSYTNAQTYLKCYHNILQKYSISFLITGKHLKVLSKEKIMSFILSFMEEADKNISEIKISMNSRARSIATDFIKSFCSVSP